MTLGARVDRLDEVSFGQWSAPKSVSRKLPGAAAYFHFVTDLKILFHYLYPLLKNCGIAAGANNRKNNNIKITAPLVALTLGAMNSLPSIEYVVVGRCCIDSKVKSSVHYRHRSPAGCAAGEAAEVVMKMLKVTVHATRKIPRVATALLLGR
jgi:hypothetical protein